MALQHPHRDRRQDQQDRLASHKTPVPASGGALLLALLRVGLVLRGEPDGNFLLSCQDRWPHAVRFPYRIWRGTLRLLSTY